MPSSNPIKPLVTERTGILGSRFLRIQFDERTLKDEEVVVILDSIIAEIKEKFNGVLRV